MSDKQDIQNGDASNGLSIVDLLVVLVENKWKLVLLPALSGGLAIAASFLIPPVYTARTVIIPPVQQHSAASMAVQSLGALAGLAGVSSGVQSPVDQYIALMQSNTVTDRLIEQFKLQSVYHTRLKQDTRRVLASRVAISAGKKDGLVSIEVDDVDPSRAAAIANSYVEQLRRLSRELAVTEAQQRRVFFEAQLQETKGRLTEAQQALERSGISEGSLREEPRAMADAYAAARSQVTASEARLRLLSTVMTAEAPEVKQLKSTLAFQRQQLRDIESARAEGNTDQNYFARYREFKYQEALFELFARQFESARLDEARDGAMVQVVDPAGVPEHKSKPKRLNMAITAAVVVWGLVLLFVFVREGFRMTRADPQGARQLDRLRRAWRH